MVASAMAGGTARAGKTTWLGGLPLLSCGGVMHQDILAQLYPLTIPISSLHVLSQAPRFFL